MTGLGRKCRRCSRKHWNISTGELAHVPGWSCVILSLSTGVPGNRRRTVPMAPTFTSYATKQELKSSVCTLCAILTQQERLKAVCSQRFFKSCWVMRALKQRWTGTSASHLNLWIRLCGNLNQIGYPRYTHTRKWCKNGVTPKAANPETLANTGFFKEM